MEEKTGVAFEGLFISEQSNKIWLSSISNHSRLSQILSSLKVMCFNRKHSDNIYFLNVLQVEFYKASISHNVIVKDLLINAYSFFSPTLFHHSPNRQEEYLTQIRMVTPIDSTPVHTELLHWSNMHLNELQAVVFHFTAQTSGAAVANPDL